MLQEQHAALGIEGGSAWGSGSQDESRWMSGGSPWVARALMALLSPATGRPGGPETPDPKRPRRSVVPLQASAGSDASLLALVPIPAC